MKKIVNIVFLVCSVFTSAAFYAVCSKHINFSETIIFLGMKVSEIPQQEFWFFSALCILGLWISFSMFARHGKNIFCSILSLFFWLSFLLITVTKVEMGLEILLGIFSLQYLIIIPIIIHFLTSPVIDAWNIMRQLTSSKAP